MDANPLAISKLRTAAATAAFVALAIPAGAAATISVSTTADAVGLQLLLAARGCHPRQRQRAGKKRNGEDRRVGGATSDAGGAFRVSKRAADGKKYYAVVAESVAADHAACAADTSRAIEIGRPSLPAQALSGAGISPPLRRRSRLRSSRSISSVGVSSIRVLVR